MRQDPSGRECWGLHTENNVHNCLVIKLVDLGHGGHSHGDHGDGFRDDDGDSSIHGHDEDLVRWGGEQEQLPGG